ncbi:hypothetical protein HRbin16_00044 [bacterium HR16]|nr:hypothetical protein HRbin16_00044 [bacterium HR16]
MRAYVKTAGTNIVFVDIDTGERVSVSATAIQKLFGVAVQEGDVWDFRAVKLDDIAENFRKWQVVQQA